MVGAQMVPKLIGCACSQARIMKLEECGDLLEELALAAITNIAMMLVVAIWVRGVKQGN
jgi:hypothetical protein